MPNGISLFYGMTRWAGPPLLIAILPRRMAVSMRLTRVGGHKDPVWRVVVADSRSPRDGRFIETVGRYNAQTDPSTVVLDEERVRHWLDRGAQPSDTVKKLLKIQGIAR